MPNEVVDVCRNTSATPEPPVYLSTRACNKSRNMLGDFLHHTGKIIRGHAIRPCRQAYPYLFALYLHETKYFPYGRRSGRSCLSVCIWQETMSKVVSASVSPSSKAAPMLSEWTRVSESFGYISSSPLGGSFPLESPRRTLSCPSACARPSIPWCKPAMFSSLHNPVCAHEVHTPDGRY